MRKLLIIFIKFFLVFFKEVVFLNEMMCLDIDNGEILILLGVKFICISLLFFVFFVLILVSFLL